MKKFSNNSLITVVAKDHPCFSKTGVVRRLRRCDNGAWVEMHENLPEDLCSFPQEDPRRNHILLYPEDCTRV